jgi:hypothetical protein
MLAQNMRGVKYFYILSMMIIGWNVQIAVQEILLKQENKTGNLDRYL